MPPALKRPRSGARRLALPATPAGLTRADIETPSDTLAALLLLRAQFPAALGAGTACPPVALDTQLAAVLELTGGGGGGAGAPSASTRPADLVDLTARRVIRPLRLPALPGRAGTGSTRPPPAEAWVFESDFAAAAVAAVPSLSPQAVRAVLGGCPGPGVSHAGVVGVLARACGGGEGGGESDGGSGPTSSASSADSLAHHPTLAGAAAVAGRARRPTGPPPPAVDAALAALLRAGVLARDTSPSTSDGGGGRYLFALPGGGALVRSLTAGRAAVLGSLRRRRGGVAPAAPASSATVLREGRGGPLDARFVVRDLIGGGWLVRLASPGGWMLRVGEGVGGGRV